MKSPALEEIRICRNHCEEGYHHTWPLEINEEGKVKQPDENGHLKTIFLIKIFCLNNVGHEQARGGVGGRSPACREKEAGKHLQWENSLMPLQAQAGLRSQGLLGSEENGMQ